MDKTTEINDNQKQTYAEAMAETQDILNQAEGWVTLCASTDGEGDMVGSAKFFIEPDQLTDLMVATALNEPTFGRSLMKAAKIISQIIYKRDQEVSNK